MRRSQFTESEIIHLIEEADAGVPVDEICRTASVSLRTFYRWRRQFSGLSTPAVMQMRQLQAENRRLRSLVTDLAERLHAPAQTEAPRPDIRRPAALQRQASTQAAERCGGSLVGRFASVRVTR